MSQIKIYGLKSNLDKNRMLISTAIHNSVMTALKYPKEKKFHRFIPMESDCFIYPDDRTSDYIIIEISMFEGRTIEAKKSLIRSLYDNIQQDVGISTNDVEITIFETPKENWGIRGLPADELILNYKIDI
jgi:4-oxalocrotonate tautomerase family enzyme